MKWNSDNIIHQMYWTISFIYRKYFGNGYTNINEDCLYLNIYSPKVCIELKQLFKSFPVIGKYFFWIHDKYMIKNIVSGDNYKLSYNNTNLIQFFMFTCNSYLQRTSAIRSLLFLSWFGFMEDIFKEDRDRDTTEEYWLQRGKLL